MITHHRRLLGVAAAAALALAACTPGNSAEPDSSTTQAPSTTVTEATTTTHAHETSTTAATIDPADFEAQIGLYTTMRNLWTDHMQWTWSTVDAFFHNQDGLQAQLDRLLANQADIGAAIVPFYGQEAGDQLTALLTTHIEQAVPVLTAAQEGDQDALDLALADWYANAEEIADFLSAANPDNWPQSATRPMMEAHIDTTTVYSVDLLGGDYVAAVADYDVALEHMIMMADTLSAGLIAQFPDQFGEPIPQSQIGLYTTMRNLWTDHMQWTWSTVDAFFHNQDGLQAQLDRLLANQADIGAAIVPFYGQEAGDQLTALLTTHIEQAVPVLTAAQEGDQDALDLALADWYANAEEIADFLSAANPDNWPQSATRPMMEAHIDTTTVYSVDLLGGDYVAAVADYDTALDHMIMMADTLSAGLIAQFPDQFEG